MGKNKNRFLKKSKEQAYCYKEFIEKSSHIPESTVPNSNSLLIGTDEFESNNTYINENNYTIKKPFKYKVIDWLRDNYISVLVTVFLIAIIGFLFGHGKSIAVINYRLDSIEKEISSLDNNVLQKEVLELKLDNLKKEMENKFLLDVGVLKSQIGELEKTVRDVNQ